MDLALHLAAPSNGLSLLMDFSGARASPRRIDVSVPLTTGQAARTFWHDLFALVVLGEFRCAAIGGMSWQKASGFRTCGLALDAKAGRVWALKRGGS